MNTHLPPIFAVHQGYRVLTHSRICIYIYTSYEPSSKDTFLWGVSKDGQALGRGLVQLQDFTTLR